MFEVHNTACVCCFVARRTGIRTPINIRIIARTTSNSISVKPVRLMNTDSTGMVVKMETRFLQESRVVQLTAKILRYYALHKEIDELMGVIDTPVYTD